MKKRLKRNFKGESKSERTTLDELSLFRGSMLGLISRCSCRARAARDYLLATPLELHCALSLSLFLSASERAREGDSLLAQTITRCSSCFSEINFLPLLFPAPSPPQLLLIVPNLLFADATLVRLYTSSSELCAFSTSLEHSKLKRCVYKDSMDVYSYTL